MARDRSCSNSYSNRENVAINEVCMKYVIYFLTEMNDILKWEEIGKFGKPNNNKGTIFFPKIIRKSKSETFPLWPEHYLGNYRFEHQKGSQILYVNNIENLFGNLTNYMSRDIADEFPLIFTNKMSCLTIFQI